MAKHNKKLLEARINSTHHSQTKWFLLFSLCLLCWLSVSGGGQGGQVGGSGSRDGRLIHGNYGTVGMTAGEVRINLIHLRYGRNEIWHQQSWFMAINKGKV